jgi:hypothetical protein
MLAWERVAETRLHVDIKDPRFSVWPRVYQSSASTWQKENVEADSHSEGPGFEQALLSFCALSIGQNSVT